MAIGDHASYIPPMLPNRFGHTTRRLAAMVLSTTIAAAACTARSASMTHEQLTDFATRYAAAWSSQSPDSLAAFYSDSGSLKVNGGAPAVGRAAVRKSVEAFMTAFPDMVVRTDSVIQTPTGARFHWIWTGTNTGPGGTGKSVRMHGYEEWTFGARGLIAQSLGHYDEAEYQRQLKEGAPPS